MKNKCCFICERKERKERKGSQKGKRILLIILFHYQYNNGFNDMYDERKREIFYTVCLYNFPQFSFFVIIWLFLQLS